MTTSEKFQQYIKTSEVLEEIMMTIYDDISPIIQNGTVEQLHQVLDDYDLNRIPRLSRRVWQAILEKEEGK